jgi:hypothetical protein
LEEGKRDSLIPEFLLNQISETSLSGTNDLYIKLSRIGAQTTPLEIILLVHPNQQSANTTLLPTASIPNYYIQNRSVLRPE